MWANDIKEEKKPLLLRKRRKMTKRMPSVRMILVAIIVSLAGSFHFGYQLVITNPSQKAFINFLNITLGKSFKDGLSNSTLTNVWSFVVAILFLGSLIGSFAIRMIADRVGRKRGLYVSIGIGVLSAAASMTSKFIPSFILYVISRVTMGFSVSLSLGLSALFLTEASPIECRGAISMITGVSVQFGTVVGAIIAMPQLFGTNNDWYLIYVVEGAMMLAFAAFLPFMPESPGYLAQKSNDSGAVQSLIFYHLCDEKKAEQLLSGIKEEQARSTRNYTMIDVVKKASLRTKATIGMVVAFAMSFTGVAVINAYAVEILESTGLTPLQASLANVGIAMVSVVAIVISSMVVDKFGRRSLLLIAFTGVLICNIFIFGLMFTFDKFGYNYLGFLLIFVICVFIIFFAIGPGPLCYFITAELVGQSARSAAQSWASVVQMACRFFLVTAYLPMKEQVGGSWSYLILFVVPVFLSMIYLYFNLPETKNKNAYEVEQAMAKLPTLRCCNRKKVAPFSDPVEIKEPRSEEETY